jgi:tetraacyldisaccharide 4'-kinase
MEAWLTDQWQRNSFWQIFLRPVSWLFRLLVAIRRGAYRAGFLMSTAVGVPVIIVGNISVGGTGKTPLVLALVEALTTRGMKCGIVTRGYQRRSREITANVIHVLPASAQSTVVSDEATLLATRSGVPVYAAINRVEAAQTLLKNHAEVDVIISDDGLQHYALQRDIEICVIDGMRGLGNGALLPAGQLRESASRLATVDAVVVSSSGNAAAARYSMATPTFDMTLANEVFINMKSDQRLSVQDAVATFSAKRVHALAGIGNPQRFFAHLANLGVQPTSTASFPDHYNYRASDIPGGDAEIILMTEKDAVKCNAFADERMWFMRVDAVIPNDFIELVMQKLSKRKA